MEYSDGKKVGVIVTDSGSNMVKAFCQSLDSREESEDEEEDETDFEILSRILTARRLTTISHSSFFCQVYKLAHTMQLIIQKFSEDTTTFPTLSRCWHTN